MGDGWHEQFKAWVRGKLPEGDFRLLLYDDALVPAGLLRTIANRSGPLLVVLPDSAALERVSSALGELLPLGGETRRLIPMPEVSPLRRMWIPENEAGRSAALEAAISREAAIFMTTPSVLFAKTLAPRSFKSGSFCLKKGDSISPSELASKLVSLDYDNEVEVHEPGEFSRRGGIFDIFSPLYETPVRLEFWGDDIDSMRFFMPDTQRSFMDADELRVIPRGSALLDAGERMTAFVKDFFPKSIQVVLVDAGTITDHIMSYLEDETLEEWKRFDSSLARRVELVVNPSELMGADSALPCVRLSAVSLGDELAGIIPELGDGAALWHWQQLRDSMARWCESGYTVVACCSEKGEVERFRELLGEDSRASRLPLVIEQQHLGAGLLLPDAKLALLSSAELFGRKARTRRRKVVNYRHDDNIEGNIELEEGAYVVHVTHGIAIFRGIKMLESADELQEVMELEFDEGVRLYVPLEQSFLVSRYLGAGKALPKLSRMDSAIWRKSKADAAEAARDLAAELIRVEAMRRSATGCSMKPSVEWENPFASSFPYQETADQTEAIRAVLNDMEAPQPMDRLLCGDVGYGKTEVAIRAAFRAVLNGKQVAVLVPTTVLAQQHYQNFRERMAEYPVNVEMISRFRTLQEQREILGRVASGEVDILIGTHRIIQEDVHFRSLGLLVIDEEQRFGVKHKQLLKSMRTDLDILTMTATPIPRTLYFSLSGIRNLSTIMTAPVDRLPVTTIVANFDKELVRLAIRRELEREGQVFLLYNRVKSIERVLKVVQELVPGARCAIAHGQMKSGELEGVMTRFVKHEIDILICTTIIESGVDIPNVNTIIIDRADRFGLSELYQLRGRVGRHHRQAYAYMLLPPMGALAQNARERLSAIRRYTHLGAGFKLAMRDLEIRGAGNILGTEQSGHIAAVGFDLYCQLLKDAVNGLSHTKNLDVPQCQVTMDRLSFAVRAATGKLPIGIPLDYMADLNERIDAYKRLANIKKQCELDAFKDELRDRFGPLPQPLLDLLQYNAIRIAATAKKIISINVLDGRIYVETSKGLIRDSSRQIPALGTNEPRKQLDKLQDFVNML